MVTDYQTKLPNYNLGLKFWYKKPAFKEALTLQSLISTEWSNKRQKSCSICSEIFSICLTILLTLGIIGLKPCKLFVGFILLPLQLVDQLHRHTFGTFLHIQCCRHHLICILPPLECKSKLGKLRITRLGKTTPEPVLQRCSVKRTRSATLLKQRLRHRCFSVNFGKFLRAPFSQNTSVGCFCAFQETIEKM